MDFQEKYLKNKVETASPESLVTMMYEGAIKFMKVARDALIANDLQKTNHNILRAQKIVSELAFSLDKKRGGDIARNLESIYLHINERMVQANIKKDVKLIEESIELLSQISSAWQEAVDTNKGRVKKEANMVG
ncbi:MAG: flagellar export chaperone FliS [Actinomycetota bacterium]|nr:flagellar export chaperone FliS [Actinomycetota bacterium]